MAAQNFVYLDANAGLPISDELATSLISWIKEATEGGFGNPSSSHSSGRKTKSRIRAVRDQIVRLLGSKGEVIFTSSATESIQSVLSIACDFLKKQLITSKVEHEAVLSWINSQNSYQDSFLKSSLKNSLLNSNLSKTPYKISVLSQSGEYNLSELEKFLDDHPSHLKDDILVSLLWANNDTGIIQKNFEKKILKIHQKYPELLFHFDCVQVLGKINLPKEVLKFSLASFSAAKLGGISGCGFLWIGPNVPASFKLALKERPFLSGHQEQGRRGGTENWLGISVLGFALNRLEKFELTEQAAKTLAIRDVFEQEIQKKIADVKIIGVTEERIPNTSRIIFKNVDAQALQMRLDIEGIMIGLGSACSSGVQKASIVLSEMGYSSADSKSSVRVSFIMGEDYNVSEIVEIFKKNVEILRNQR